MAKNRLRNLGILIAVGILIIGFLTYWFVFRDTSAASVDSTEAAEARQEALAEAAADAPAEPESAATGDDAPAASDDTAGSSTTAGSEAAQPDSAASVGSIADGLWAVDTSIGTFDEACLDVVCSAGFVGFRINEELVGFGAKTVVGRTPVVTGTMQIAGTQITSVDIVADMTEIITDDTGRTSALKSAAGGLETNTFPEARFVLAEPIELGELPVEGAAVTADAVGDLTVHGVTNRVTVPLTAELQAGIIVVFGSLVDMELSDYDIPKPTSVVVLSVEEIATMELQLFFRR
ncbi:MAG: YceI family protein [Actinomycetota bacterium]